jgi:hypothetical protein
MTYRARCERRRYLRGVVWVVVGQGRLQRPGELAGVVLYCTMRQWLRVPVRRRKRR